MEHDAAAEISRPDGVGNKRSFQTCARIFAGPLVALSLTPLSSHPAAGAQTAGSYYTDAQADAGQTVFASQCAICHGDKLEGRVGPALAGQQFLSVSQYQELTAGYLFKTMSRQMPKNAPGSLSKADYVDLLAYILKVNGYPAGPQQLTDDDHELRRIKIEPTGNPQQGSSTEDRQ